MIRRWKELTDQQRQYMLAIFECDRAIRYHDFEDDLEMGPINISGWLDLAIPTSDTLLGKVLSTRNLLNFGTGATLKALETRGLISRKHRFPNGNRVGSTILVKLTPTGRQLVLHFAQPIPII